MHKDDFSKLVFCTIDDIYHIPSVLKLEKHIPINLIIFIPKSYDGHWAVKLTKQMAWAFFCPQQKI